MLIQLWDNKKETHLNIGDVYWVRSSSIKLNGRRAAAWEICFLDSSKTNVYLTKNRFDIELVQE